MIQHGCVEATGGARCLDVYLCGRAGVDVWVCVCVSVCVNMVSVSAIDEFGGRALVCHSRPGHMISISTSSFREIHFSGHKLVVIISCQNVLQRVDNAAQQVRFWSGSFPICIPAMISSCNGKKTCAFPGFHGNLQTKDRPRNYVLAWRPVPFALIWSLRYVEMNSYLLQHCVCSHRNCPTRCGKIIRRQAADASARRDLGDAGHGGAK